MEGPAAKLQRTLALIKPDAVAEGRADEIMHLAELEGFTVVVQAKIQLTPARAESFYAEHKGKPFFPTLINFMSSGPLVAMVLVKQDAIGGWRALMGPTNSLQARASAPKSLRALYGTDGTRNATHGSDSPTSTAREIAFFFPSLVAEPLPDPGAAQAYIVSHLQPTLVHALTELAKQKPASTPAEAITFLAGWLLDNNPNKPKVVAPAAGAGAGPVVAAQAGSGSISAVLGSKAQRAEALPMLPVDVIPALHSSADEQNQAAATVQAAFRGHQARQQLEEAASA